MSEECHILILKDIRWKTATYDVSMWWKSDGRVWRVIRINNNVRQKNVTPHEKHAMERTLDRSLFTVYVNALPVEVVRQLTVTYIRLKSFHRLLENESNWSRSTVCFNAVLIEVIPQLTVTYIWLKLAAPVPSFLFQLNASSFAHSDCVKMLLNDLPSLYV